MVDPIATTKASFALPQQPVSSVHLEALFEQHMQKPAQPMGEAIVEGVQGLKAELYKQSSDIQARIDAAPDMSLPELIKIQSELSRLVLVEETLARTVSKSTQNIDTLLKSQ